MSDKPFNPSPQQAAFFDWVEHGSGSALVIAVAGAGKTTTLTHAARLMQGSVFLGAYNKKAGDELYARVAGLSNVRAGTFHSAGWRAWRYAANGCQIEEHKMKMIFDRLLEQRQARDHEFGFALKLASLAKQHAVGVLCDGRDDAFWRDLVEHHDLDYDLSANAPSTDIEDIVGEAIETAKRVVRESIRLNREIIDFDDMIFAPLFHNVRMWPQDWVLIDEAQDTNPARRALAKKMLRPGGRLVAVGDPRQAIYGFTGADADAMDIIKHEFNCVELPLTVTYRCPKAVVAFAQRWVSHIQAHESAPDGIVRTIDSTQFWEENAGPGDAILCRNTKPLIELAYQLIRNERACHVEGREIGKGLLALAGRWKLKTLAALRDRLEKFRDKEIEKWRAKGKEQKAAAIEDKVETLVVIIDRLQGEGKSDILALQEFIERLFRDTAGGEKGDGHVNTLLLSTVHKSKGREWDRVYLLGRAAYMPSPWARQDWQMVQEDNLCYVAATRAKRELVEVGVIPTNPPPVTKGDEKPRKSRRTKKTD